jgi:hypothetical protein
MHWTGSALRPCAASSVRKRPLLRPFGPGPTGRGTEWPSPTGSSTSTAPADPPTFRSAVPNWHAGDVIPLVHRSLRVVEVRDADADQAPTLTR